MKTNNEVTMNILTIAHFQNDQSYTAIFIDKQILALKNIGSNIKVIVPIPFFKTNYNGKRISKLLEKKTIDDVDYFFVRFLSFSNMGKYHFNYRSAIFMINIFYKEIVSNFDFDIIHAHTFGLDSRIGEYLKEKTRKKLVVTTHGTDLYQYFIEGKQKNLLEESGKIDKIVCVSNILKNKLLSVNIQNVCVIHNGYSKEWTADKNESFFINKYSNLKDRKIIFNYTGALLKQKNVDITIKVFYNILKNYPNSILYIVGDGNEMQELKLLTSELMITEKVFFLGRLSNDEVFSYMEKSHFFIMPSTKEAFGIVYLEAMASGSIIFGKYDCGISDIVEDGVNGFLIFDIKDIEDKINMCINNEVKMIEISKEGYKTSLNFTWERNANCYLRLYKDILN